MNIIKIVLIKLLLLSSLNLFANTAVNSKILKAAKADIMELVDNRRIESSWKDAKILKFEKATIDRRLHYIVTYFNDKIKNKTRKHIYISVDTSGNVKTLTHIYKHLF
jgi:hypothetical protein